jgi:hypothetical protein
MYRGRFSRQSPAHHPPLPAARAALSLAAAVALGATAAAAADKPVYRCQDGDTIAYSQGACGPGAREIDVHHDTPSADAAAAADARLQTEEAAADQAAADTARRQRIRATERELEQLRADRDHAVAELAAERQHGTEERADDTFREQQTGEMQAVIDRYDTRIEARELELRRLQQQE